jgi:hypothetical protein
MSGLEELRKKLAPLFDAEKGFSSTSTLDPNDSYTVSVFFSIFLSTEEICCLLLIFCIFLFN